jgi:ketosteroid isomerase-like protein
MSKEAVEVLRRAFEDASRVTDPSGGRIDVLDPKTVEVVFDSFDPEIEFREDPRFPEAGVFTGTEAVRRYFNQFIENFDEFAFEAEDFIDLGDDRVLILFRFRTRGKGSGAKVEARPGWIYTVRDGKAVRIEAYFDQGEALEAAGLRAHGQSD